MGLKMSSHYCGTRSRRLLGPPLNTPFAAVSQMQVCHSLLCYLSYSSFYYPVKALLVFCAWKLCHSSSCTVMTVDRSTEELEAKPLLE